MRFSLFLFCLQMNGIELPFERGSMEDVNVAMVSSSGDTSGESQESMSTQVAEEREANIKLDYSRLPERLKKVCSIDYG